MTKPLMEARWARLQATDDAAGVSRDDPRRDVEHDRSNTLKRLAEEEGFEPPEPFGSTVFKTAAIDHSATPPRDVFYTGMKFHVQSCLSLPDAISSHTWELTSPPCAEWWPRG